MARRDRLVDSAFFAFALVAGALLFSNQARQGELPDSAVALGTLGGSRRAVPCGGAGAGRSP
jgi:hypothetical protein